MHSDLISLLEHLFLGRPERLLPLCGAFSSLPDTGQALCYDSAGNVIDCASENWPGQDGYYASGCPPEGRFTDNGDGTVTDNCTGLMWQQATAELSGGGLLEVPWQGALQFCEALEFAGHADWRLPNARELESVVDYGRVDPCMDPVFQAESGHYWTSSTLVGVWLGPGGTEDASFVAFPYPVYIYHSGKDRAYFVRAVRTLR